MTGLRKTIITRIGLLFFMLLQTAYVVYACMHHNMTDLHYFRFDSMGILFLCVLTLITYLTTFYGNIYLSAYPETERNTAFFWASFIMLVIFVTGVYLTNHAGLLWVFVEGTTLCVALLIYHRRTTLSIEATWKYVFICSTGIALAFIGILFIALALQNNKIHDLTFHAMRSAMQGMNMLWLKVAFLFLLVGFSTKMETFPMQPIAIDANAVAPSPISAFISTALMNAGFLALFRFYMLFSTTEIFPWIQKILFWTGVGSIVISAVYMLSVHHLKRLSAYSSLEHAGIVCLGLACGGIGYYAALLHLALHSLTKAGLFYHFELLEKSYKTFNVKNISNYLSVHFSGSMVFFMLMLMIAAIPPSGMFMTKLYVLSTLLTTGHYGIFFGIVVLMAIIVYALIKNTLSIVFAKKDHALDSPSTGNAYSWYLLIPQIALIFLVIILGYFTPETIRTLIYDAISLLP